MGAIAGCLNLTSIILLFTIVLTPLAVQADNKSSLSHDGFLKDPEPKKPLFVHMGADADPKIMFPDLEKEHSEGLGFEFYRYDTNKSLNENKRIIERLVLRGFFKGRDTYLHVSDHGYVKKLKIDPRTQKPFRTFDAQEAYQKAYERDYEKHKTRYRQSTLNQWTARWEPKEDSSIDRHFSGKKDGIYDTKAHIDLFLGLSGALSAQDRNIRVVISNCLGGFVVDEYQDELKEDGPVVVMSASEAKRLNYVYALHEDDELSRTNLHHAVMKCCVHQEFRDKLVAEHQVLSSNGNEIYKPTCQHLVGWEQARKGFAKLRDEKKYFPHTTYSMQKRNEVLYIPARIEGGATRFSSPVIPQIAGNKHIPLVIPQLKPEDQKTVNYFKRHPIATGQDVHDLEAEKIAWREKFENSGEVLFRGTYQKVPGF